MITDMELITIIESLNSKPAVSAITINNLDDFDLSEQEKDLIRTYLPEKALIIYGTLAPGKPNHSKIQHINGKWEKAVVWGKLENKGWGAELGFYGFMHATKQEQQAIEAYVLFSDELVDNRQYLDDFEGSGYRRILTAYELDGARIGVGYIYAINET